MSINRMRRHLRTSLAGCALLTSSLFSVQVFAIQCEYNVTNDWGSGFTGNISIANDGSGTITGWQVEWSHADGSSVTSLWNADYSGSNPYTASNLSWNGNIPAGGSVEFGFQGVGDNSQGNILNCVATDGGSSSSSTSSSSTSSSSTTRGSRSSTWRGRARA